jgi:uroporphyrinogen-III synthase
MRVLITRELGAARRTAADIAALGHEPIIAPLTEIVGLQTNIDTFAAELPDQRYDAVIATSAQAFRFLRPPAALASLAATPLFVVGARTVEAAAAVGLTHARIVAVNGAELAQAIIATLPSSARALYLAGQNRKTDFERELSATGVNVNTIETYAAVRYAQMPAVARDAFWDGRVEAVLHFSRRSAEIFIDLATAAGLMTAAARARHCAISDDAAAPLRGFTERIAVAEAPDAAALYRTLE